MAGSEGTALDLDLTRVPGDRRAYSLEGIGTLRLEGFLGRAAVAQSTDATWQLARRGIWQREVTATDALGVVVGRFEPRAIRRGGAIRWGARELTLEPASAWRERYELAQDGRGIVVLDGKGWGKRPVRVSIRGDGEIEAGLLLFAVFVVRGLAEDASGASGAGASAAVVA